MRIYVSPDGGVNLGQEEHIAVVAAVGQERIAVGGVDDGRRNAEHLIVRAGEQRIARVHGIRRDRHIIVVLEDAAGGGIEADGHRRENSARRAVGAENVVSQVERVVAGACGGEGGRQHKGCVPRADFQGAGIGGEVPRGRAGRVHNVRIPDQFPRASPAILQNIGVQVRHGRCPIGRRHRPVHAAPRPAAIVGGRDLVIRIVELEAIENLARVRAVAHPEGLREGDAPVGVVQNERHGIERDPPVRRGRWQEKMECCARLRDCGFRVVRSRRDVVLLGDGRETVFCRLVGINQARDVLPKTVKGVAGGGGRRVHCLVATAGRIALQLRENPRHRHFFVLAATAKHGKIPKGKGAAGADGEARQRAEDGDVGGIISARRSKPVSEPLVERKLLVGHGDVVRCIRVGCEPLVLERRVVAPTDLDEPSGRGRSPVA